MSQEQHLDDAAMIAALETTPGDRLVVHVKDCPAGCGARLAIGKVSASLRHMLPYTPSTTGWRAFERTPTEAAEAWRSTKRYGFVPARARGGGGFLPHDCPRADHKGVTAAG